MAESNPMKLFNIKTIVTVLYILSYSSPLVVSQVEPVISEHITTCQPNSKGSTILTFTTNHRNEDIKIEDQNIYEIKNTLENVTEVKLKQPVSNDTFIFKITLDPKTIIQIKGSFIKYCENSYTSSCTVIIAFLASLCLILFTALALALIILRRKKPITFKFGQKDDQEYNDRKQFSASNYEETYDQSNKNQSIDVTNGGILTARASKDHSPRPSYPRKSSLKPPKSSFSDELTIINNNNSANHSSHENSAYIGPDLEVVDELSEEKDIEEKPNFQEGRRKSTVTFGDTTEVKFG